MLVESFSFTLLFFSIILIEPPGYQGGGSHITCATGTLSEVDQWISGSVDEWKVRYGS
jgi:hypothetical protein